jgi:hypothetical protein
MTKVCGLDNCQESFYFEIVKIYFCLEKVKEHQKIPIERLIFKYLNSFDFHLQGTN